MVNGIDIFREHFNHFKEQYTVIGGFACDLLMNDAGLDFRQTVDIDMADRRGFNDRLCKSLLGFY